MIFISIKLLVVIIVIPFLTACGTLTGIPSHGGGKRFAVEQELVASSSRAAAKDLDLHNLVGRKVALYVTSVGDQGSGILTGGRYTLDALLKGEYINNPATTTRNEYPVLGTTATTTSGTLSSVTLAESALNAPSLSVSKTKGGAGGSSASLHLGGQGNYRNETLISNPRDIDYLSNLLQTIFFLRGIQVVAPQYADTDVFITVDVFGTIRSRTEWQLYNTEDLTAVTKIELFAADRHSGQIIIRPQYSAWQAQYKEQYALWVGPLKTDKWVEKADPLMVTFSDVLPYTKNNAPGRPGAEKINTSSDSHQPPDVWQTEIIRSRRNGQD